MKIQEPGVQLSLDDYLAFSHLSGAVEELRSEAARAESALRQRTIWMVNSTAQGGGVAELLPAQISLLRQLGLDVRWAVIDDDTTDFFAFTKRLHNLIHAAQEPHPTAADRAVYEAVNHEQANELIGQVSPADIVIVHDPQPLAAGAFVKAATGARTIWRCHIGVDEDTPHTRAGWEFLRPYTETYDDVVFSVAEYVPPFLRDRTTIIHPTIDPLSHKNRDLSLHKLVGIMCDADLLTPQGPLIAPPFSARAQRLQADGTYAPATQPEDFGLIARPIVTQVSRWDRLKGFAPLLEAFCVLKQRCAEFERGERHSRQLASARLVLAGPDPASIQDDPEAQAVLAQLGDRYRELPEAVQRDIAIITLPMQSRKENALMVNALQRASDVVVQNSIREAFGLTVAEAMWKRIPVLGSARACGIRLQLRDGVDGRLAPDPEDVTSLAGILSEMLASDGALEEMGRHAHRRVFDEFLVFTELRQWLRCLAGPQARP